MQWTKKDIDKYIEAKQYIDTILLPLIPFHFSNDETLSNGTYEREVLRIFTKELEKELTGRTMLIPEYTYLKSADRLEEASRVNSWIHDSKEQPFKYIFLITFDVTWKKNEQALNGNLIWLPVSKSNDLYSKEMEKWVHENVSQVSELIRSYW